MRLTPTEQDRLLIFTAAQLASTRRARGLLLNVPEATAIIANTVCEAARDGLRLEETVSLGRSALSCSDVLPGVADILDQVQVEAVFETGTHLVVIVNPIAGCRMGDEAPGAVVAAADTPAAAAPDSFVSVTNTGTVPISISSHYHFFETNKRLRFNRSVAYGRRLAVAAGETVRFDPGVQTKVGLTPIGGDRTVIGFAGLVDGPLDAVGAKEAALRRARTGGFLDTDGYESGGDDE